MSYGSPPDGGPIYDPETGEVIGEAMPALGADPGDHVHDWHYIATNEPWAHERCTVCEALRVRHVVDGQWHFVARPWLLSAR